MTTMNDTGTELLRAIMCNPGEDTPRLVYADWLAENGQPERAEFIQVQIALHGETHEYCHADCCVMDYGNPCKIFALHSRERELRACEKATGIPHLVEFPACEFSRGFVSAVTCTAEDWLRHHAAIFWHPGQTERCQVCQGHWEDCKYCNGTGRIDRPFPGGSVQPIERVVLTTWPRWSNRKDTTCSGDGFSDRRWPGIVFEESPS